MSQFQKLPTSLKIVILMVAVALYFNVGYLLGNYYYENVLYSEPKNLFSEFLGGGWGLLSNPETSPANRLSLGESRLLFSFIWPIALLFSSSSWLVYLFQEMFNLVFLGGLAKSFSVIQK